MGSTDTDTPLRAAMARLRERLRPLDKAESLTLEQWLEVLDGVADVLADWPDEEKPDS